MSISDALLDRIIDRAHHSKEDIVRLLSPTDAYDEGMLFKRAYEIKKRYVGNAVYLRGLIETGNICEKDCYYCGVRKGNRLVNRYLMSKEEILSSAKLAWKFGYGSLTLQSGEMTGKGHALFIEEVIREIKDLSGSELGITLSFGEQKEDVYRRWFKAGAHRYLLRIETSDRDLYGTLHPHDHSFEQRLECLHVLKEIGYQVGTGVMIGLPGQTVEHLADDIIFFRDIDADMIGMGPYIPHRDTPLAKAIDDIEEVMSFNMNLALRMIAATRIVLRDVNIASTTALQAVDSISGLVRGLTSGANVIMPNMTGNEHKGDYRLYENKPLEDENSAEYMGRLESRIRLIGEYIGYNQWGDSPHFKGKSTDVSTG